MVSWIAVAVGGALGAVARYAVSRGIAPRAQEFPIATMLVNVGGCFAAGLLAGLIAARRIHLPLPGREFLFVGLLGGFTTFSAFSLETLVLARNQPMLAVVNVAAQVAGALLAVWIGYRLGTAG